jgi:membrane protease subunit HflC
MQNLLQYMQMLIIRDAEFYAFTRSLKAYVNSFKSKSDMLVIDPDSDFFKYFKDIK